MRPSESLWQIILSIVLEVGLLGHGGVFVLGMSRDECRKRERNVARDSQLATRKATARRDKSLRLETEDQQNP
jgi:hypothetical protein